MNGIITIRDVLWRLANDNSLDLDGPLEGPYDQDLFVETEFVGDAFLLKVTPQAKKPDSTYVRYAIGTKYQSSSVADSYGMTHGPFESVSSCLTVNPLFVDRRSYILGFDPAGNATELYKVSTNINGTLVWFPVSP